MKNDSKCDFLFHLIINNISQYNYYYYNLSKKILKMCMVIPTFH